MFILFIFLTSLKLYFIAIQRAIICVSFISLNIIQIIYKGAFWLVFNFFVSPHIIKVKKKTDEFLIWWKKWGWATRHTPNFKWCLSRRKMKTNKSFPSTYKIFIHLPKSFKALLICSSKKLFVFLETVFFLFQFCS